MSGDPQDYMEILKKIIFTPKSEFFFKILVIVGTKNTRLGTKLGTQKNGLRTNLGTRKCRFRTIVGTDGCGLGPSQDCIPSPRFLVPRFVPDPGFLVPSFVQSPLFLVHIFVPSPGFWCRLLQEI